jgi:hypothetical protein
MAANRERKRAKTSKNGSLTLVKRLGVAEGPRGPMRGWHVRLGDGADAVVWLDLEKGSRAAEALAGARWHILGCRAISGEEARELLVLLDFGHWRVARRDSWLLNPQKFSGWYSGFEAEAAA